MTNLTRSQLLERKTQINDELRSFRSRLSSLTEVDIAEIERLYQEQERIERDLASTGVTPPGQARTVRVGESTASRPAEAGDLVRLSDGRKAAVERGQSFRDHPVVAEDIERNQAREQAVVGYHGSFGAMVRSMSTTSGSAIVPTVWASSIIDRARNIAAVLQAGAQVVPMDAKVVNIGRLTGDPSAAFRSEGGTITASDPTFDNVTLTATTMSALVVGSIEFFMDALDADQVVENAIASAIALQLDKIALFGGLTTGAETGSTGFNQSFGSPNPTNGVLANLLANASSSVLGGQTNGTTQTAASFWNEIIDVALQPSLFNETANAVLWTPQAAKYYAKVYDTTNQPLQRPPILNQFTFYSTAQIPAAMTQGTSTTNQTDVFAGDWSQLIIGQRLGLSVQVLTERYAELGQIGIVANWRGDINLTRPRAFAVYRFIKDI